MRIDDQGRWVSDDGYYVWDDRAQAWLPAGQAPGAGDAGPTQVLPGTAGEAPQPPPATGAWGGGQDHPGGRDDHGGDYAPTAPVYGAPAGPYGPPGGYGDAGAGGPGPYGPPGGYGDAGAGGPGPYGPPGEYGDQTYPAPGQTYGSGGPPHGGGPPYDSGPPYGGPGYSGAPSPPRGGRPAWLLPTGIAALVVLVAVGLFFLLRDSGGKKEVASPVPTGTSESPSPTGPASPTEPASPTGPAGPTEPVTPSPTSSPSPTGPASPTGSVTPTGGGRRYAGFIEQAYLAACNRSSNGKTAFCRCTLDTFEQRYSEQEFLELNRDSSSPRSKEAVRQVAAQCLSKL